MSSTPKGATKGGSPDPQLIFSFRILYCTALCILYCTALCEFLTKQNTVMESEHKKPKTLFSMTGQDKSTLPEKPYFSAPLYWRSNANNERTPSIGGWPHRAAYCNFPLSYSYNFFLSDGILHDSLLLGFVLLANAISGRSTACRRSACSSPGRAPLGEFSQHIQQAFLGVPNIVRMSVGHNCVPIPAVEGLTQVIRLYYPAVLTLSS